MRSSRIHSRWPAGLVLMFGLLLLVWMYPLAHLELAGRGQGQLCEDLYGIPDGFAAEGFQPEQVVSTEHWSALPPGWSCEFRAYQSDLLVTKEPADWKTWVTVGALALVAIGVTWLLIRLRSSRRAPSTASVS